jgi:hypothetical protein
MVMTTVYVCARKRFATLNDARIYASGLFDASGIVAGIEAKHITERRKFGDQTGCAICGQDIEWHGKATGWIDRGSGRDCLPYTNRDGEIVKPTTKHKPPRCW